MLIRITLAVHDSALGQRLLSHLARPDILVEVPRARKDLWERIVREPADVLIISQSLLPNPLKDKMRQLQSHPDSPAAVVLSDSADPKVHARLMAEGCDAVLFAGLAVEQVRDVIETMLEKRRRLTQKRFFAPQPLAEPRLADFVSESPGMAVFMNVVPRLVRSDTTLLIEGETGVGKERLASAIHAEGPRSAGRFVALNCGALPEHLMESELFGHVRGAFTGATAARRGWFEIAHHGTLFLDEVGEIPTHLQVKLLRVLQEHEIQPVGSEKSFSVDVRVIAASNRPLEPDVESGRFRRDLYHRLSVVTVSVPSVGASPSGSIRRPAPKRSSSCFASFRGHTKPHLARELKSFLRQIRRRLHAFPSAQNGQRLHMRAADVDDQNSHALGLQKCPSRPSNSSAAFGPQLPAA